MTRFTQTLQHPQSGKKNRCARAISRIGPATQGQSFIDVRNVLSCNETCAEEYFPRVDSAWIQLDP